MAFSKKALAKEELVILIILIISFAFLTVFLIYLSNQSDSASKELACRISVLERAALKDPIGGTSLGNLFCKTIEEDIGKKAQAQKRAVMYDLAEHTVRCWNMFGEGALSTLKDRGDFFKSITTRALRFTKLYEDDAFCFVCYEIDIYNIKNEDGTSAMISKGDFEGYLSSKVYTAESGGVELNCNDGKDNDGDGLVDCEDTDSCEKARGNSCVVKSRYIENTCEAQGGTCASACEPYSEVELVEPEWSCKDKHKQCCISKNKAYTYTSYLYEHGGHGGGLATLDYDDGILFEPGENYAIAYVEPIDNGIKDSYVLVGKYQDIAKYCQVK